jgi:hypothetical protein
MAWIPRWHLALGVTPAVQQRRSLSSAAPVLLTEPAARALRREHLGCIEPEPEIPDSDLVLDNHGGECRPSNLCL